ncbi:hypothetical protein GCM10020255_026650 [Rhodococcus baikonurensis]
MNMKDAANMVAEIAAEQWGIITTAQARAHDVTPVQMKRLTDRGALERVHHGIYTMTRMPYDPIQDIRVAWIALDPKTPAWDRLTQDFPTGVVSHRTAAKLHQLGDIDADWTEFTCQRRIRIDLPDIKIHTGTVEVKDWTTVEGLPVTTARKTVDDLAAAKIDGGHLASIAQDAIAKELATPTTSKKRSPPRLRLRPPPQRRKRVPRIPHQTGRSIRKHPPPRRVHQPQPREVPTSRGRQGQQHPSPRSCPALRRGPTWRSARGIPESADREGHARHLERHRSCTN